MRAPWLLLLVGCGPQLADSAGPLKLQTVLLESGRTHEPYTAWLEAAGGDPPYRWEVDSELPPGIVLNPAGALTGIPTQKGTTPVQLRVRDDAGKQVETTVDLEVRWARNAVGCGRSKTGTFTEGASGADWGAVDWQATGGWTSFEIPLPDPEVTRIEIHIGEDWFEAWLALPGTPEGDQDLVANHAYHYAAPGAPIRVDLGTAPDLESYRAYGEPIQLVLIAPYPVPWSIETTCTEGPIIQDIPPSPAFLGDALTVNFSVHGDQGSVSWSQDSPLPDWATFDPETGKIEGTSQEAGVWGFELTAADAAGHTDSVTTGFGVYEHTPLLCDEPHVWQPVEGYLSGALSLEADPRGYRVFELPLDPDLSAVTAHFDAPDGGELGVVLPGDPTYRASGPRGGDWVPDLYSVEISPQSWPTMGTYVDEGVMHSLAYLYFGMASDAAFWFECDRNPRLHRVALPVLEAGGSEVVQLDVIGGTAPYVFTATGLPAQVQLDPGGVLSSTAPVEGTWTVDLTIDDALGLQTTQPFDLWVGEAAACQGLPRVRCGESHVSEIGTGDPPVLCLDRAANQGQRAVLTLTFDPTTGGWVDGYVGTPGSPEDAWENWVLYARGGGPDAAVIDEHQTPPLQAYGDLPIFLGMDGAAGVAYELRLDCL